MSPTAHRVFALGSYSCSGTNNSGSWGGGGGGGGGEKNLYIMTREINTLIFVTP